MKALSIIFVLFASTFASASSTLTCVSLDTQKEATFVITENAESNDSELKIYRSYYGHSTPVQIVSVTMLNGSRGSIVAYGDQKQNSVLLMNLQDRDSTKQILGSYTDARKNEKILISCK
jgi:hypothetical protein